MFFPKKSLLGKFTPCFVTLGWHTHQWDPLCPSNRGAEAMAFSVPGGVGAPHSGSLVVAGGDRHRGVTLHPPSPWPAPAGELWLRGTRWQVPACRRPGRSVPQPNLAGPSLALGQAAAEPGGGTGNVHPRGWWRPGFGSWDAKLSAGLSAGSAPCCWQGVGCETPLSFGASGGEGGRGCFWGCCPTLQHPGCWERRSLRAACPGSQASACLGPTAGAGAWPAAREPRRGGVSGACAGT